MMISGFEFPGWISEIVNSAFSIALVGGFVGAVGGALGAQHIAERTKRRDELLKELRNTNAAIMVSFSICNDALALKKQHVEPMYKQFTAEKARIEEYIEQRKNGIIPPGAEHRIEADLRTYPAPTTAVDTLKGLVFEKISAYGRALALVSVLDQSLIGLRKSIAKRDAWVNRFASGNISQELFHNFYFGLSLQDGSKNQEYSDLVSVINEYTNDVAFFSSMLCADLIKHGDAVRRPLTKKSEVGVPKVSSADFTGPRKSGLLPPEDNYSQWLKGFSEQDGSN